MNKWVSKHKIIAFIIYNLICWTPFLLLAFTVKLRPMTWIVFGTAIFIISLLFVFSTNQYVLNQAAKQIDETCNPHPLLEVAEQQLQKVWSKSYKQLLLINKAAALRELGRFDEVLSILSGINIDQYSTTLPITKIVYYNNLTDILIAKEDIFQAKIWYSKMNQMIQDIKMKAGQKHTLLVSSALNQAELLLADHRLEETEALLTGLSEPISNRQRIAKCMLHAKLYMQQNKFDEARPYLQFVIDWGNQLHEVSQAQKLLERLA
ncbi:MAG: hypothetical protein PHV32_11010 [Eubacteriales bacterium]|nr:hypothetical protein [Oscillospiraceae bacterium]MDD4494852.1 hypothetical protein [Eubacteriales bacterium]